MTQEAGPQEAGSEALEIERFEVTDTTHKTTVVGFDAQGNEVGRLDLIHGRFALTEGFRDDYATAEVDGRKLDVEVRGHSMRWEGAGYEPLLHMPAIPSSEPLLVTFVNDPHVKPVLDRWQLGYEPTSLTGDEQAYISNHTQVGGSLVTNCDGQTTCGPTLVRTGTGAGSYAVNTCGGGAATIDGVRITEFADSTKDRVHQCCPSGSGGKAYPWWAQKICPKVDNTTSCGTTGGACKGCTQYNASYYCSVDYNGGFSLVDSWYHASALSNGQACEAWQQCASDTCGGGTCVTGLDLGAMCWDNGTNYGYCAGGETCVNGGTGTCKFWETCWCGGAPF